MISQGEFRRVIALRAHQNILNLLLLHLLNVTDSGHSLLEQTDRHRKGSERGTLLPDRQRSFGPEDKLHPYSTLVLFRSLKSARPKNPAAGTGKPGHVLRGPYGRKQHRSAKTPQGRQAENWQATTGTQVSSRLS